MNLSLIIIYQRLCIANANGGLSPFSSPKYVTNFWYLASEIVGLALFNDHIPTANKALEKQ